MASNIRAKSIEGYVTDSAGNILRNSQIIIKQSTPYGSFTIEAVNSDDSGYFISKPIPNGSYEIYESGIVVSRIIHNPNPNSIQCFKAHVDNYNIENIEDFDSLSIADPSEMNNFEAFIQIESTDVNVERYGSSFPIYEYDISVNPDSGDSEDDFYNLSQFFGLDSSSRITTTRFDIEYYAPITALSNMYQRIRWSGVPAIRFREDSKLVIPLDYYSISLNHPKYMYPVDGNYSFGASSIQITKDDSDHFSLSDVSTDLLNRIKKGDIIKLNVQELSTSDIETFYGIVSAYDLSAETINLERLRSSRFVSTTSDITGYSFVRAIVFDGMFRGITNISEDVNERFTVVENVYAQSLSAELYNYSDRI